MNTFNFTIDQICDALNVYTRNNYSVWRKEEIARIYLNGVGYNTKKVRTTAYIYIKDGEALINCHVECPSQTAKWCANESNAAQCEAETMLKGAIEVLKAQYPVEVHNSKLDKSDYAWLKKYFAKYHPDYSFARVQPSDIPELARMASIIRDCASQATKVHHVGLVMQVLFLDPDPDKI